MSLVDIDNAFMCLCLHVIIGCSYISCIYFHILRIEDYTNIIFLNLYVYNYNKIGLTCTSVEVIVVVKHPDVFSKSGTHSASHSKQQ